MSDDQPAVEDRELYEAWLETHRNLVAPRGRRVVLGSPERVHDAATGICVAVVYRNPDLDGQRERARLWELIRSCLK